MLSQKKGQKGVIALDLGWREKEAESNLPTLKMAVIAKGHGTGFDIEEYCLPVGKDEKSNFVKSSEYIQQLQGQLDDAATELGKSIKSHLKKMEITDSHPQYRFWRGMAHAPDNVTLSFEQAYKLAGWMSREQETFSEAIKVPVENWHSKWHRRYRELHNLRKRILANRDEEFRKLAARLAKEGLPIILENPRAFHLGRLAEKKDADNKLSNRALANRFLAAPGKLRAAIENAAKREGIAIIYVNPRDTSKTCSACGVVNTQLKAEEKWVCPSCGVEHDRDHNAAVNIGRQGMAGPAQKGTKR